MSKKKDKIRRHEDGTPMGSRPENENIVDVDLCEKSREYNINFCANINILRQSTIVNCGLKVVQMRVLYTLYVDKSTPETKKEIKVSKMMGDCMGNYHPHGDASIKEVIEKLSQPWCCNQPLIYISKNIGSAAGNSMAAPRYVEGRMSDFAWDVFFSDFDPKIVDMKPNYTGDTEEPDLTIPCKIPMQFVNDVYTIGKGSQTKMYGCNLKELVEETKKRMNDPNHDIMLYPELASGADVIDGGQFEEICRTGKGKFVTRAKIDVDEEECALIIKSFPMRYNYDSLKETILSLIESGKMKFLEKIDDENSTYKVWIKLWLKPGTDPYKAREFLYKKTLLQKTESVNCKFIDRYKDADYTFNSAIDLWLMYRRDYKRRYINAHIVRAYERRHKLYVLSTITDKNNLEESIKIMKNSRNKQDIEEKLMKKFKISSLQAREIAEMPMYKISKEWHEKFKNEIDKLDDFIFENESKIRNKFLIDKEIMNEMDEIVKKYDHPRKTKIMKIEDYQTVIQSRHLIVISKNGMIKKLPDKAKSIGSLPDGDSPSEIYYCDNSDNILLFDTKGIMTKVLVSDIPGCSTKDNGFVLRDLYPSIKGSIVTIKQCNIKEAAKLGKCYIVFMTKNGLTKKTRMENYITSSKSITAIQVREGDELVAVKIMKSNKDLIVYTKKGFGIRLNTKDIQESNRNTIGSRCIKLDDDDIIGVDIIEKDDIGILTVTSKGNVKLSDLKTFPATGKEPLRVITLNNNENISKIKTVKEDDSYRVFMKSSTDVINVSDLEFSTRLAKGKSMIKVKRGDMIVDMRLMV